MSDVLFQETSAPVHFLVAQIQQGTLALPDLQRPFVWQTTKVRDLLDSMYRGYPVGYLLFWRTGVGPVQTRNIGVGVKPQTVPQQLIVDGQQRLTSLYAVMTGEPVIRENFDKIRVRIAFRPSDGRFSVADVATDADPEYLPDVTAVWTDGEFRTTRAFIKRLASRRALADVEEEELSLAISRLENLKGYVFRIVDLNHDVDEEDVADIFVRINSEGVVLNQSDFILTLMSVWWEQGRRDLEAFARAAKDAQWPRHGELDLLHTDLAFGRTNQHGELSSHARPYNHHFHPDPSDLLRVSIALAFRRAVLKATYTMLRGRDVDSGRADPERRDAQFRALEAAQIHVLDLTNWHEFVLSLDCAGFSSRRLITSETAVVYSYAFWLLGRVDFGVPISDLRPLIARWFFMAQLTSRYSGSFESQFEQDVQQLRDLATGDSSGFVESMERVINSALTRDYWAITLPEMLATSASRSPSLMAYIAALTTMDAEVLFSSVRVRNRVDPKVLTTKTVERHHLFPKEYLKRRLGETSTARINQIANMALVDWVENIKISDQAPSDYWDLMLRKSGLAAQPDRRATQVDLHALPDGWQEMTYDEFLRERRVLMADVVRRGFEAI